MRTGRAAGAVAIAGLVGGCMRAYSPGELLDERGARSAVAGTVGCLDVAVHPVPTDEVGPAAAIVDVAFGERCGAPACVDLRSLRGTARGDDGRTRPMTARDPRDEMHEAMLDARTRGSERIVLSPPGPAPDEPDETPARWVELCVDLASVACAKGAPSRVVCFGRPARGGAT